MTDAAQPLRDHLHVDEEVVEARWNRLLTWVRERFGEEPGIEGLLFLIGVQARGRGFEPDLEKETKQALIMEGTYHAFEMLGLYEKVGMEADGSWIWERVADDPEQLAVEEQEKLLRIAILAYFDDYLDAEEG